MVPPPQLRAACQRKLGPERMPSGEAVCITIAGSCPVLYLEQEVLEGEKPAGYFTVCVLLGNPMKWGMVCDQGEMPAWQIIMELLDDPFDGESFSLHRCIPLFTRSQLVAKVDDGVLISLEVL